MTISSLSAYTSLLNLQSSLTNNTSTSGSSSTSDTKSLSDTVMSMLQNTSDPLLQDSVTLSPAALGQTTTQEPQTYDAKGLLKQLQQMQSDIALNDPLLSGDSGTTDDSSSLF